MRVISRVSAVVALAGLLFAGCATKPLKREVKVGPVPAGGAGFLPATTRVDKGDKVEVTVTNTHDRTHGFSIDAFHVKRTVDVGKPIVVKFTAKRAGKFAIYCQLHPAHKRAILAVK